MILRRLQCPETKPTWNLRNVLTWWNHYALREGVSSESLHAGANRNVIEDVALGVHPTGSWTRILALLIDTSEVALALGAQDALWSTLRRHTYVIRQTGTRWVSAYDLAQGVRPAGRRRAGWRSFCSRGVIVDCKGTRDRTFEDGPREVSRSLRAALPLYGEQ